MFKRTKITLRSTYDYWHSEGSSKRQLEKENHIFNFEKHKEHFLISIKNQGFILNPEIDFLQARIVEKDKMIIVEAKPFVNWLYKIIMIGWSLICVLQIVQTNVFFALFIALMGGLIYWYNRIQINRAIDKFEQLIIKYGQTLTRK